MLGESTEAESTEYVVKEKYRKLTPIINYLTSLSIGGAKDKIRCAVHYFPRLRELKATHLEPRKPWPSKVETAVHEGPAQ
jgi:hypothetical protein